MSHLKAMAGAGWVHDEENGNFEVLRSKLIDVIPKMWLIEI